MVDELTLIREGPVRVKPNRRDNSKLRVFVEIFINKVGYEIRFVPEEQGGSTQQPKNNPPKKPNDEYDEDGEEHPTIQNLNGRE